MLTSEQLTDILRPAAACDLEGVPLYVGLISELPKEFRPSHNACGYFSPLLDVSMRDHLSAIGKWHGRGVGLVIDDVGLAVEANELAEGDSEFAGQLLEQRIIAVAVHELAHALESPFDLVEVTPDLTPLVTQSIYAWCKSKLPKTTVPWSQHDLRFVRTAAHAAARAEQLGGAARIPRNLIVDGGHYGLSRFDTYCAALADEIDSFTGTFAELRETRPPDRFLQLWHEDLDRFADSLASTASIVRSLVAGHQLYQSTK